MAIVKPVNREEYQFVVNGKTWTLYDKRDAEYFDRQLTDARRYQWLREQSHPFGHLWLSHNVLDEAIDEAIGVASGNVR